MSTWLKVVVAIFWGGALGANLGGAAQSKLIFSVYYADNITRRFGLSGEMCLLLGAVTTAALVLWKAKEFSVAALFSLAGGVLCLLWLSLDRDSALYRWWTIFNTAQKGRSFEYWNNTPHPYREYMAEALIFNGVPLLWAIALVLWGLKLSNQKRNNTRQAVAQVA